MTRTISAYKARTNLGEILNEVYYKGDTVIIERMGKPLVKMTAYREGDKKKTDFTALFGIWKDMDEITASKIKKEIEDIRKKSDRGVVRL